jgi:hypothetical protein
VKKDKEYCESTIPISTEPPGDKYLVEAHRTPIWITWEGGLFSVKSVQGKKKNRTSVLHHSYRFRLSPDSVTLQYVFHNKIHEQEEKFSKLKGAIEKVHVLEGMPTLEAKRKGEIQY